MRNKNKNSIVVGRMAYERYRLIETKDGIIRQGMGLKGKIEAIFVHVTGGIHVKFKTNSQYDSVPIECVTIDESTAKIDINILESNKILTNQTRHSLCNSKIKINRQAFLENLIFWKNKENNILIEMFYEFTTYYILPVIWFFDSHRIIIIFLIFPKYVQMMI